MMDVDVKLLATLQSSTCFGIAYDEGAPECKQCDTRGQCKAKTEGANIATPKGRTVIAQEESTETKVKSKPKVKATKATTKETKKDSKKATSKPKKEIKPLPDNLPPFKKMSMEELRYLAKERGVVEQDYGNPNINRMRLIMGLKTSYRE